MSRAQLREFKNAGRGFSSQRAGEKIMLAALDYFKAEITVLSSANEELFRVGHGYPSHHIHGVHIHPVAIHTGTGELMASRKAIALVGHDDFNRYLGLFIQALEVGRFRVGLRKS